MAALWLSLPARVRATLIGLGVGLLVGGLLVALWAWPEARALILAAVGLGGAGVYETSRRQRAQALQPPPVAPVDVVHTEARGQVEDRLEDDMDQVVDALDSDTQHPAEALAELGRRRRGR